MVYELSQIVRRKPVVAAPGVREQFRADDPPEFVSARVMRG